MSQESLDLSVQFPFLNDIEDHDGIMNEIMRNPPDVTSDISIPDEITRFMDEDEDVKYNMVINFVDVPLNLLPWPADAITNTDYPGAYDFQVTFPNSNTRTPWSFSQVLNKIFTGLGQQFPIEFRTNRKYSETLYIRITPQYSDLQHSSESVIRCIQHGHHSDSTNKNIPPHITHHVIRCANQKAQYLGDKDKQQHLSVALPLSEPQAGVEGVRELFCLMCLSSCASPSINRRNLELIFTLENQTGIVFGRKCVNARICACPKRDKEKAEEDHLKKSQNVTVPRGKKRKVKSEQPANPGKVLFTNEPKRISLNLNILGEHNVLQILSYAESQLGYDVLKHKGHPLEKAYQANLDEIINCKQGFIQNHQ